MAELAVPDVVTLGDRDPWAAVDGRPAANKVGGSSVAAPVPLVAPSSMPDEPTAMSRTSNTPAEAAYVRCCLCGVLIEANPTAKCQNCIAAQLDPASEIPRNVVLGHCRHCGRYERPPWLMCEWESPQLLALCLKRLRALQQSRSRGPRLVDAKFLYTEPHSRRIQIQVTVQAEAGSGAVVEQDATVEFVLQNSQCDECKRAFTPHVWTAVVQVRQRAEHRRNLLFLEQVILKYNMHEKVSRIVVCPEGLDFQFPTKTAASKFTEFVSSHLPTRVKQSRQLVSHDPKSNTAFNKYSSSVEVCAVSRDDLVFVPFDIASHIYGGVSPFLLCTSVSRRLTFVDPLSLRTLDIVAEKFWKHPFQTILTRRHTTRYIVLNVERVNAPKATTANTAKKRQRKGVASIRGKRSCDDVMMASEEAIPGEDGDVVFSCGGDSNRLAGCENSESGTTRTGTSRAPRFSLAEIEVVRLSDFGKNDTRFVVQSHLGSHLRPGNVCLGYDLDTINLSGYSDDTGIFSKVAQSVILLRRCPKEHCDSSGTARRRRQWVLKRLPVESRAGDGSARESDKTRELEIQDIEDFKCDIEEDPRLRQEVNLWRDPRAPPRTEGRQPVTLSRKQPERAESGGLGEANSDSDETEEVCGLLEGLTLDDVDQLL